MKIKFNSKYLITICICTYNRNAGLLELLKSINKIKLPNNIDFSNINVVVVDNFKGKSKEIKKQNLFDFNIDWGDGTVEDLTDVDAPFSHTYAAANTYTVTISGTFPRIYFYIPKDLFLHSQGCTFLTPSLTPSLTTNSDS